MKKLGPAGTGPEKWTIDAKKDWKKRMQVRESDFRWTERNGQGNFTLYKRKLYSV